MSKVVRVFVGALTVMMLVAAGCGDEGSEADTASAVPEAAEDADESELPAGVVAVADGNEITEETFEVWYEQALAIPAIAEQVEGPQGDAIKPQVRAQVLSQLLVSDILSRGAEDDFDIEVTDEAVQARLQEMEDEAGGEEAFATELADSGLTRDVLVTQQLPLELLIEQVEDEVAPEDAEEPPPPAEPGQPQPPSEAQVALQEWAVGKFSDADVSIRSEFGTWNPQTGQVQPPGAPGGMPPGQAPPQAPPPG